MVGPDALPPRPRCGARKIAGRRSGTIGLPVCVSAKALRSTGPMLSAGESAVKSDSRQAVAPLRVLQNDTTQQLRDLFDSAVTGTADKSAHVCCICAVRTDLTACVGVELGRCFGAAFFEIISLFHLNPPVAHRLLNQHRASVLGPDSGLGRHQAATASVGPSRCAAGRQSSAWRVGSDAGKPLRLR
jgi:hypothetical protein